MFGIKLDEALDKRVSDFARAKGQAKSEVGRRALVEYLDRHAFEEELRRQINMVHDLDDAEMDELEAKAFDDPDWK
jgi:predicted transcriptional regulator